MNVAVDAQGVAEVRTGPNQSVIEKWVEALESREYQQTTGTLHRVEDDGYNKPGFCCLGVLCDLAVREGVIPAPDIDYDEVACYAGNTMILPEAVQAWAGLPENNPVVHYELTDDEIDLEWDNQYGDYASKEDIPTSDVIDLADLNDSHGRNFQDIAQIIRDNYLS